MTLDRVQPTVRPSTPVLGRQVWRRLLFAHWPVDPAVLRPLIPASLSLDTYEGTAYVGLVPFLMRQIRPAGLPAWAGLNFLETNIRTYVHVEGQDPGVYFFSLDASSRLAVAIARYQVGLPYFHAHMHHQLRNGVTSYALHRQESPYPRFHARYRVAAPLPAAHPDSLDFFLLERYLLHVERDRRIWTLQVHHRPYPARQCEVLELHEELFQAAGLPPALGLPPLTHYAEGVAVEIFQPRPRG